MTRTTTLAILLLGGMTLLSCPARAAWTIAHPSFTAGGITSQSAGSYGLAAAIGQGVAGTTIGGRYALVLGAIVPAGGAVADVPGPPAIPTRLAFLPPRPNPARASVTFAVELPRDGAVRLDVFGPDGRRVARVLDRALPAGRHEVAWSVADDSGRLLPPGVYLASLSAASERILRRVVVLGHP